MKRRFLAPLALFGMTLVAPAALAQTELTLWSHWAAEEPKRGFVEQAIADFEAANPDVKIEVTWFEKNALYAALNSSLRAGQAPDIFYAEPNQTEYIDNNFLLDLTSLDWDAVEPWAKEAWTHGGVPYGLPLEGWTVELFYNKDMLADLGISLPDDLQLGPDEFRDLMQRSLSAGITPMSLGVGDRPFPGAQLASESLLKKLGVADYSRLMQGDLPWSDPRVVETLEWIKSLADDGLLPNTFSTMKLTEAHIYFHTTPGALTFLNGSWYTSRAFNAPDNGGQPEDFALGIMRFPQPPGATCPYCRTVAVGGSYVANAATEHPEAVLAFFNSFLSPEVGNRWLNRVFVQTGIKSDPSSIVDPRAADYFSMIAATNTDSSYFFGIPIQVLPGGVTEVFNQVINNALPGGNIEVQDAVDRLEAAY